MTHSILQTVISDDTHVVKYVVRHDSLPIVVDGIEDITRIGVDAETILGRR